MARRTSIASALLATAVALVSIGCAQGTSGATPLPVATSADEFATAVCSSLRTIGRAIGNPDTGADSALSASLEAAITRGDYAGVEQTAATMTAELERGRLLAGVAAGWQPGAALIVHVDRLLLAFEAMVEAKRTGARQGLEAAGTLGQTAFERAGGLEAWQGMLGSFRDLPAEVLSVMEDCRWWEDDAHAS